MVAFIALALKVIAIGFVVVNAFKARWRSGLMVGLLLLTMMVAAGIFFPSAWALGKSAAVAALLGLPLFVSAGGLFLAVRERSQAREGTERADVLERCVGGYLGCVLVDAAFGGIGLIGWYLIARDGLS